MVTSTPTTMAKKVCDSDSVKTKKVSENDFDKTKNVSENATNEVVKAKVAERRQKVLLELELKLNERRVRQRIDEERRARQRLVEEEHSRQRLAEAFWERNRLDCEGGRIDVNVIEINEERNNCVKMCGLFLGSVFTFGVILGFVYCVYIYVEM